MRNFPALPELGPTGSNVEDLLQFLDELRDFVEEIHGQEGNRTVIGDYVIFQDEAGNLLIRAPDATIVPLVVKE